MYTVDLPSLKEQEEEVTFIACTQWPAHQVTLKQAVGHLAPGIKMRRKYLSLVSSAV